MLSTRKTFAAINLALLFSITGTNPAKSDISDQYTGDSTSACQYWYDNRHGENINDIACTTKNGDLWTVETLCDPISLRPLCFRKGIRFKLIGKIGYIGTEVKTRWNTSRTTMIYYVDTIKRASNRNIERYSCGVAGYNTTKCDTQVSKRTYNYIGDRKQQAMNFVLAEREKRYIEEQKYMCENGLPILKQSWNCSELEG